MGYYGSDGLWHDTPQHVDVLPVEAYSASVPAIKEDGVNIEDPNMWSQVSSYIASKLVAASDLAKRVGELENALETLRKELQEAHAVASAERQAREDVQRQLRDVQLQLDHEQRAVHDLVMERDIVVQERNEAQAARDAARRESNDWQTQCNEANRLLADEREHNRVLEERCNHMSQRIAALKDALGGLQNL